MTAYSLSLETNKEKRKAFKAPKWTFKQYLDYVDPEHSLTLGLNEVEGQSMQLEWSGTDTILARLFSIANSFGAELEFITELNDDYSLKRHVLNVYKVGNIGKDKTGMPIRVGKSLKVINYTANIDELYTAIRVHGKDGLTIAGLNKKVYDSDKKLLYYTQGDTLYAPQARDRFPAIAHKASDSFICLESEDTEHSSKESLYAYMLGELKKHSEPKIDYETEGYVDGQIGDRMLLIDSVHYDPPLYVEARISEQTISLLDKSKNKTVFTNYERKKSEIANELLAKMNALIEENKVYDVQILTSNGYSFKNGQGSTTLTARVMDGPREVTNEFSVNWYRETDLIGPDASITVQASSINEKVVYRIIAYKDGVERGRSELTLINVNDGADGQDGADGLPGKPGADGRTPYFHTAYADSADGQLGFSTTNASGKLYMGTCTDYIQSDPDDYRAYTWVKIKGDKGETGPAGRDGKGVKSYAITYQAGTSGVSYPTGNWSSTIPNVPNGQYLWSKTTLTYTDNTTSDTYSVAYFPVNGATGATGNGISSYTAEFYLSTSKTTQSGGSWTTTPPTWSNGKYIWTRYKIGYTNGSTAYTTPHCSSEWEAVNDVQKNLDAANQNIAKKVDQEAYDNDKQVIYDDISKKLDDEEFRKFQKTMNDLKSSYESFVGEGGRYEKELQNAADREQLIVQNLGEKVQQLNFINTYIRESEEGIVIGAKGNPMQMLLSKDSLSFMDGGQVVAYFSNQSFYINRGAVVDSLQVGVHKMTRINNEFTVIQYVPN
ncbi:phage tail protein [Enterococcus cecorum]|uniref:phage tail protein n=2 Tax=Enterococcus cecorum TaxID=44008 RepID=UPI001FADDCD5|nr:phage tail protein [Enterococcus cecorum]MCJ0547572.1 hypothetical protein [Enterococcus cecorum]